MTFTGRPGDPAVVYRHPRLHLFARAADDSLLHWWWEEGARGAENLGGRLDSDPVATLRTHNGERLDVFALGAEGRLLHWWWDGSQGRIRGPEPRPRWGLVDDPVAVAEGDRVEVIAHGSYDALRRWWSVGDSWYGPTHTGRSTTKPALVSRGRSGTSLIEIFSTSESGGLQRDLLRDGELVVLGEPRDHPAPGQLAAAPAAASWSEERLDVFAPAPDGTLQHWGWQGEKRRWFGPEPCVPGRFSEPPVVAAMGIDDLQLLFNGEDGRIQHWRWAGLRWEQIAFDGPPVSRPAIAFAGDRFQAWAWETEADDEPRLWNWSWDGATWQGGAQRLEFPSAGGEPGGVVASSWPRGGIRPAADFLLRRAEDMVLIGVSWSHCRVTDPGDGAPATIEPLSDEARLVVTFPPQHLGEEVAAGEGPLDPPVRSGGAGVWRASLSGPSRVVYRFKVSTAVELTAAGVLSALQLAPVDEGSDEPSEGRTAIELPWRLIISPKEAVAETPGRLPDSDSFSLWRTRLRPAPGRGIVAYDAGPDDDPFEAPLPRHARELIVAQEREVTVDRLELSALGGTLSAHGSWPGFEWDHDAVLGRDQKVRTLLRGVLFPTGHQVQYVELTDRSYDPLDSPPVAALRKHHLLTVTEPVVRTEGEELRTYPFSATEITTTTYVVDDPAKAWVNWSRPPVIPDDLTDRLDSAEQGLRDMRVPPGDWVGAWPDMEDLVHAFDDLSAGGDPDESEMELARSQAEFAAEYLRLFTEVRRLRGQIAAIRQARTQSVPWHFQPRQGGTPLAFPVRCTGPAGEASFSLPMRFVTDTDWAETATMSAFDSLDNSTTRVHGEVAAAYRQSGGGVVELPATPLRLPGGQVHPVRRLQITGVLHGRGFRPRLGPPGLPADPRLYAGPWACTVDLPALRMLLPDHQHIHQADIRFSDDHEKGLDDPVPLRPTAPIDISFVRDADRSGGLIAPVISADGLSAANGPVNVDGLRTLEPAKIFAPGATVFGFDLPTLVGKVESPPAITTDVSGDGTPVVTMVWRDIPLVTHGAFQAVVQDPPPDPASATLLQLTVESSARTTTTECVISNFALLLPEQDPLLRLDFQKITYRQSIGAPPELTVTGPTAAFLGKLSLLQSLQQQVGLGEAVPRIEADSAGITARYCLPVPDVQAGAFVMRNLTFGAAVTVPFRGDPVSVALSFASREKPFNLSVLMFGGGGYVDVEIVHSGLRRMEISLEFGAAVAVDFVLASGEAHVLGGIRYELLPTGEVQLTGYLRIGGSLEILGLVSVAVELLLTLGYETTGNRLTGRATLVIELDLTLYSDSVELDSGVWVIAGGEAPAAAAPPPALASADSAPPAGPTAGDWEDYRKAFS